MKILIKTPRDNGKGYFRMALVVPLGIAKWNFIWRHLPDEARMYAGIAGKAVDALREYRRKYGHWDLVDVYQQDDGTRVLIRI